MPIFKIQHSVLTFALIILVSMALRWLFLNVFINPFPNAEIYAIFSIYFIELCMASTVLKSLNIRQIHRLLNFKRVALSAVVVALGLAFLVWLLDFYLQMNFNASNLQQEIQSFNDRIHLEGSALTFLSVVLLAPIVEEILFRGILLQSLKHSMSAFMAGFLVSLLFAAVHFSYQQALPLFIASSLYVVITLRYNSLVPAIVAHIFNNALTFYYYFYFFN